MTQFHCGHAAHPDWRMALTMAAAQLDASALDAPATLGSAHAPQVAGGRALVMYLLPLWVG